VAQLDTPEAQKQRRHTGNRKHTKKQEHKAGGFQRRVASSATVYDVVVVARRQIAVLAQHLASLMRAAWCWHIATLLRVLGMATYHL